MAVFLLLLLTTSVCSQDLKWVWGYNSNNILPSDLIIPGRVEPQSPQRSLVLPRTTTPRNKVPSPPAITTFHPSVQYLLGDVNKAPAPKSKDGGLTTKSRVVDDTLVGLGHVDHERYTTLDRLFKERGHYNPEREDIHARHLGGLHPKEVFYADDDLLIIKGGGFPVDIPEDQLQPIDGNSNPFENNLSESEHIPIRSHPSIHEEYNGNIPVIIPPPKNNHQKAYKPQIIEIQEYGQTLPKQLINYPQSNVNHINTKRASGTSPPIVYTPHYSRTYFPPQHIPQAPQLINFPQPRPTHYLTVPQLNNQISYNYNLPITRNTGTPQRRQETHYGQIHQQFKPNYVRQQYVPPTYVSLHGDTDVNFRHPRPPINPFSELVSSQYEDFHSSPQVIQLHQRRQHQNSRPHI